MSSCKWCVKWCTCSLEFLYSFLWYIFLLTGFPICSTFEEHHAMIFNVVWEMVVSSSISMKVNAANLLKVIVSLLTLFFFFFSSFRNLFHTLTLLNWFEGSLCWSESCFNSCCSCSGHSWIRSEFECKVYKYRGFWSCRTTFQKWHGEDFSILKFGNLWWQCSHIGWWMHFSIRLLTRYVSKWMLFSRMDPMKLLLRLFVH